MSVNFTNKIMIKIARSEQIKLGKQLWSATMSIILPAVAFIYIAAQLVANLLDAEILDVLVNFEFDWDILLSNIWTSAVITWVLVDKSLLAVGAVVLLILLVAVKQGIILSCLHRLRLVSKYQKSLKEDNTNF